VEVAIIEENGAAVGYFPFQREGRHGIPVGGTLNDFHGVVSAPGSQFDAAELVRACRLTSWRFTQVPVSQCAFAAYGWLIEDSPSMDLAEGFDAYARRRKEEGSTYVSRTRDKARIAKRDVGPVRFEPEASDPQVLDSLVAWKSRQYERIRTNNVLQEPGTLDFLKRLLELGEGEFRGVLSALYFGDRLAAVHLGIRCRDVLHLWFPTYNEELGKYSPGNIYFVEQAKAAESCGIRRVDFGTGNEKFKPSLRSFGTAVATGAVGIGVVAASMHRTWHHTKKWLQSSRFHEPARAMYRGIRGIFLQGERHASRGNR
jgi:CelD/BcsL family acetyltransferase involved in cellulose biosynthesis